MNKFTCQMTRAIQFLRSTFSSRLSKAFFLFVLFVIAIEALGFIFLLGSSIVVGRPSIENILIHPALIREVEILTPWEKRNNLHPIYGWLNPVSHHQEGTDRYGYRHNGDKDQDYRAGSIKIFVLGGSTAKGSGVKSHETYPAHLQEILRKKLGINDLHVINAGVSGYYSANEFLRLTTEILPQYPDLVISLSGTNDPPFADVDLERVPPFQGRSAVPFFNPSHERLMKSFSDQNYFVWSIRNLSRVIVDRLKYATDFSLAAFWNWSYAGYFIKGVVNWSAERAQKSPDRDYDLHDYAQRWLKRAQVEDIALNFRGPWRNFIYPGGMENKKNKELYDKYIKKYVHTVSMSQAASNVSGVPYILILQPSLFNTTRKLSDPTTKALEIFSSYFRERNYDIVSRRAYFDKIAREKLDNHSISWVDFTNIFPDLTEAYVDSAHYSNEGNKILAKATADLLIKCGVLSAKVAGRKMQGSTCPSLYKIWKQPVSTKSGG